MILKYLTNEFELKKRKLLRKRLLLISDKGFYSAYNYLIEIKKYKIVPLVFPNKKPTLEVFKRQK
jgi:hypothetical protein